MRLFTKDYFYFLNLFFGERTYEETTKMLFHYSWGDSLFLLLNSHAISTRTKNKSPLQDIFLQAILIRAFICAGRAEFYNRISSIPIKIPR